MKSGIAKGGRSERARALTVLARIIGKKRGVNIVFRPGHGASTDGKTIFLPALSDVATENDAILLEGLLDHEAMHCRFTDFDYMAHPDRQAAYKKHPLMFPIHNILEDVWGEREQAKIYPGCFQNIKKAVEVMIEMRLTSGRGEVGKTVGDALRGFILYALLGRLYGNPTLVGYGEDHKAFLVSEIGQKLTDEIWALSVQVDQVKKTEQAFELAQTIFALIEASLEALPEKSKRKNAILDLLQVKPSGEGDIDTMLEEALKLSGGIAQDQSNYPDPLVVASMDDLVVLGSSDLAALSRPTAITLGNKLEVLLETKITTDSSHGKTGRKMSSRRVSGISVGRTSVFRREDEVDGVDTALEVVIDLSGSMYPKWVAQNEDPHVVAKTATYAIGDVLDRHDVPFAITAFGSFIAEVKTYDQKWRTQKSKLDLDNLGGTATAAVLQHSAESLSLRSERRRMVVLVTDGNADDNTTVIPVMNELTAIGVEFTSIFIGDKGQFLESTMKEAGYPVTRAVNVADLPLALFSAIKTAF